MATPLTFTAEEAAESLVKRTNEMCDQDIKATISAFVRAINTNPSFNKQLYFDGRCGHLVANHPAWSQQKRMFAVQGLEVKDTRRNNIIGLLYVAPVMKGQCVVLPKVEVLGVDS